VVALVNQWRHLGEETLPDGTRLVGKSDRAPKAWTLVFRPLHDDEIARLDAHVERPIPEQYRLFLSLSNGLSLFDDHLTLDGLRTSYDRSGGTVEPYDLRTPNVDERPQDAPVDAFYIGGYDDGSLLIIDAGTGGVVRYDRASSAAGESWADLGSMLIAESQRPIDSDDWRD
jgi:SMI1/KNR4 family protein SUKH-1